MRRSVGLAALLLACATAPAVPLVAIDPGHDVAFPGALSATGRWERLYNEEMSERIERALRRRGLLVVRTRGADESVGGRERARRANAAGAALLLSVHHDSVKESQLEPWLDGKVHRLHSAIAHGFSLHVRGDRPEAVRIAAAIGEALIAAGFAPTRYHLDEFPAIDLARGLYDRRQLAVLNGAEVPAVLLECGFIIHREEDRMLRDPEMADRLAQAVAAGIASALAPERRVTGGLDPRLVTRRGLDSDADRNYSPDVGPVRSTRRRPPWQE